MKLKFVIAIALLTALVSCSKAKLKDLNTNPDAIYKVSPGVLFAGAQYYTSKTPWGPAFNVGMYNHQMASLETFWPGDKYVDFDTPDPFNYSYQTDIKNLVNLLELLKGNPDNVNHISIVRIWKALVYQRLTDLYGDIPYSEAAMAYVKGIINPKYDTQESIYRDLLKELDEAVNSLDPAKPNFGVQDMVYQGNVAKWKRFGNSLLLRVALRIADKDQATAKTYIAKALAGGVMTGNGDNVFIKHDLLTDGRNDFLAEVGLESTTRNRGCAAAFFINWLQANNDPRLPLLFNLPSGSAVYFGLPNGYDITTIGSQGLPAANNKYALLKADKLANEASPNMLMTYAEVKFMQAEIAKRGLALTPADAQPNYEAGVKAAMQMYTVYDASLTVTDPQVANYLAANPYDDTKALEMINYQYWAATFLNFYEGYANIRRSDFPKFPDNPYGGKFTPRIPTRFRYPPNEGVVNSDNLKQAISRIPGGVDVITAKLWWDAN